MSFYSAIKDIVSIAMSPELQQEFFPAKVIFIFFSVVFFIGVVYFMFVSSYLKYQFVIDVTEFFQIQPAGARKVAKRWKRIQKMADSGIESDYKLALIEADDLLQDVLKDKGFSGETFEERIKQAGEIQIPDLERVLQVHQTRNQVVYEPDYQLGLERLREVLEVYKEAIKNIEFF